ncbi:MAG TPA: glycoside hydrolase family 3 C-terminal domain-containing protein [Mycobacteriales bacterium]|nr:glycoside hydrolase family 3 C-terminal domain-containing protein [Mycobacteriales bacterium]
MDLDALLARLTPDEKASFTAGADFWSVAGLPEHGIPTIRVTDGPNGARGAALLGAGRVSALCVPCGSALGATWDPALVEQVGRVLGAEARTKGARVLLAPTVNLPRSPLFGRSFECFSEDPLLTGLIAAAYVGGVQSEGVAATVKHFVANETEHLRTTSSSDVDERVLRELYLVPFEHAVRAGVLAVMTSYNRVNGSWVTESPALMGWLRDEQGYDGVVMTDWFGVGSSASAALGVDLQMPGPARFLGPQLTELVAPEVLDATARRWLQLVDRLDAWEDVDVAETAQDDPARRAVARHAAAAATVLLENDGLLPLSRDTNVALIGPHALTAHVMGGGSAQLRPHQVRTLAEELPARGLAVTVQQGCLLDGDARPLAIPFVASFRDEDGNDVGQTQERDGRLLWFTEPLEGLNPDRFSFSAKGSLVPVQTGTHRFTLTQAGRARVSVGGTVVLDGMTEPPPPGPGLFGLGSQQLVADVELVAGHAVPVEVEYSSRSSFLLHGVEIGHRPPAEGMLDRAVGAAAAADVAVVVVGTSDTWESEGHDRTTLALPGDQAQLVRAVIAANARTVVVVAAGAPVDLSCAEGAAAVLLPWLGGEETAAAVADVLLGDAEPAGRLPVSWPLRIEHTPAYGSFPGEGDRVAYAEGLLSGYRWYDTRQLPMRWPFGHGGSYTSFAWGEPVVTGTTVEIPVTNSGTRRGSEVVQAYVEPPPGPLLRPRRELKAFAKVHLEPGATAVARLELDDRAFAGWDPGRPEREELLARLGDGSVVPAGEDAPAREPGWWVEGGMYVVHLARSVIDVVVSVEVPVDGPRRL